MFNAHYEPLSFRIPSQPQVSWDVVLDTDSVADRQGQLGCGGQVQLADRSMLVLREDWRSVAP